MDISEQYIKMAGCPEIQGQTPDYTTFHKPYILSSEDTDGAYVIAASATEVFACEKEGEHKNIWLPRQDQLQDMVGTDWVKIFEELGWFANDNVADEWSFDNTLGYGSMEQLWLAFIMYKKFNKVWEDTGWITKKS